jgi:hypothetical protein
MCRGVLKRRVVALTRVRPAAIFAAMDTLRTTSRRPLFLIAAALSVAVLGAACNTSDQVKKIGGVPLTKGTAHVDITGATEASFDAPLERAQVGTVDTVFIYKTESNDLFSITGLGVNGSAKTSTTLDLTVTTGELLVSSDAGECTITISAGDGDSENGTADCKGLTSSKGTVDIKATFSATP